VDHIEAGVVELFWDGAHRCDVDQKAERSQHWHRGRVTLRVLAQERRRFLERRLSAVLACALLLELGERVANLRGPRCCSGHVLVSTLVSLALHHLCVTRTMLQVPECPLALHEYHHALPQVLPSPAGPTNVRALAHLAATPSYTMLPPPVNDPTLRRPPRSMRTQSLPRIADYQLL
jgi:hypothetical protein